MTAIATLKKWFSNFRKPKQEHFWAWIDSFWHKSEKIPMDSIEGLENAIQGTASAEQLRNHLTDNQAHKELFDGKVDKEAGKGLSSNDFTGAYRQALDNLQDYDIELDESTTELKFKKGNNVVRRISLMFLDDEATKLTYNKVSKNLELRDKKDNLLTSIPVSHFVSNIPTNIVVQNGKIKLMAGDEVIDENAISYNDLADTPNIKSIEEWKERKAQFLEELAQIIRYENDQISIGKEDKVFRALAKKMYLYASEHFEFRGDYMHFYVNKSVYFQNLVGQYLDTFLAEANDVRFRAKSGLPDSAFSISGYKNISFSANQDISISANNVFINGYNIIETIRALEERTSRLSDQISDLNNRAPMGY